jgi:ubiquinone/menaquinone biosynthesis C-methylase UbiE
MDNSKEINRGYLDYLENVPLATPASLVTSASEEPVHEMPASLRWKFVSAVSGILPAGFKRRLRPGWLALLSSPQALRLSLGRKLAATRTLLNRAATTTLLIMTSIVLGAWLKAYLWIKRARTAPLNQRAMERVGEFVEQYPLHLYPVVLKSFELAFLEAEVQRLLKQGARWLEMAIGEGTFSAKIFPPTAQVVGLDLNPYSIGKAVEMPHVKQAVIGDCLRPPISEGYFDVVLANNFLHHVTMKEQTLANWSRVAPKLLFNESTPYWASGWAAPYMLRKRGYKDAAQRAADQIERSHLQHLDPKEVVDELVRKDYQVVETASYFSERTFFLCALYSYIMRCYGPPTPAALKHLFLSKSMRWLTIPLTTSIARLLIQFDQFQDRSRDAYVSYVCESRRKFERREANYLVCPRCGGEVNESDRCQGCGKQYPRIDGMLFLLPEEMEHVGTGYDPERGLLTPKEHL